MILLSRTPSQPSHPIHALYVFGDSLSDPGNVFQATGKAYPPSPPYFQGRYSNGPVWVEYLAQKLSLSPQQIVNSACGGATTGNASGYVPSLLRQVEQFTQTHQTANPEALYVIWAGANDYLQGAANPTATVANLSQAISDLANRGAKTLLVANLPDLGQLPATRQSSSAAQLTALTKRHNEALRQGLANLRQQLTDKTKIVELDAYHLYREATAEPKRFGFTNVTGTCLDERSACTKPDQFLFWDGIHPSAAAHRILAETAFTSLAAVNP